MNISSKQRLLNGKGTVEDLENSRKMFMQLAGALFTRPIIGHPASADTITTEQKQRIKIERMKQIKKMEGKTITEATDYEAMVYIMTVTLAQPVSNSWFNIYAFLFRKFYPDKANEIFEEHQGRKLQEWTEQRDLARLKQWLYKTGSRKKR